MLHETSEFKPLIGLQASQDGGVMLSPGDYIPSTSWEYGLWEIPGGRYAGLPGYVRSDTIVATTIAPKLHYHRSGWVSADVSSQSEKRLIRCLPLERLGGAQFFSYTVTNVELAPIRPVKRGSAFVVAHEGWPASVTIHGFLYRRGVIPCLEAQLDAERALTIIQHRIAEMVVDLSGHGCDAVVVLRFTLGDLDLDPSQGLHAWLFGFDSLRAGLDMENSAVGIWTPCNIPKPITLLQQEEAPFSKPWPFVAERRDVKRVFRDSVSRTTTEEPFGPIPSTEGASTPPI
jgi:hypothetical protein